MSVTVNLDADGRIESVVLSEGDALHLTSPSGEAVLMYDKEHDPVVPGYGRSGLASYGPEFVFADRLYSCSKTKPEQPVPEDIAARHAKAFARTFGAR